ncbi:MAG: MBOAT family protein, partial [Clostridia bacterium]|nr:MBOAT family protein [Clostridia bacterium]
MPQKAKKYYLLAASMVFYWLISGKLILFLLITVMAVHHFALWLDRIRAQKDAAIKECEREERKQIKKAFQKKSRAVLAFAAVVHIGALLMIKYSPFFTENINSLLKLFHSQTVLEIPKFIMPIGISFFTLQAVSYLVDVYRGVSRADDNIFRVALFMSFFPQIV